MPPVLGLLQRNDLVIIEMLDNVQRKTIEPIIRKNVKENSIVYTDEYNIYNWLPNSYLHKTVNHGQGKRGQVVLTALVQLLVAT